MNRRKFLARSIAIGLAAVLPKVSAAASSAYSVVVPIKGIKAPASTSGASTSTSPNIFFNGQQVETFLMDGTPITIEFDPAGQQLISNGQPCVFDLNYAPFSGSGNTYALFYPPGTTPPNLPMGSPPPSNAIAVKVGGMLYPLSTDYVPGNCGVDTVGYDLANTATQYSPAAGLLGDSSGNPQYINYNSPMYGGGGNLSIYGVSPFC